MFSTWPRWTLLLLLLNWIIYAAMLALANRLQADFGGAANAYAWLLHSGWKSNVALSNGEYWRLITAVFIHTDLRHLTVNSSFLLLFGVLVEPHIKGAAFAVLYLIAGVMGMLASYVLTPSPSVGASGAVLGLLGAYSVIVLKRQVPSAVWHLLLIGVFLLFQLGVAIQSATIDGWSHLGGFMTGVILSIVFLNASGTAPSR